MPALPPVTTATFPSSFLVMTLSVQNETATPPDAQNMIHSLLDGDGLDRI
jgi:hypothetical protein